MAFKLVVLCAALACASAGLVAPVAHYSPASAVSSSFIHQAAAPVNAYAHAAPVATYAHAAPVATYAHAAPVATYAHAAPVAVHAPHIGATSQSVVRSLGGNQAVSHYSKAVDSAFSSVRKYDTRITNDAFSYAHAPLAHYAAPVAHAAYAAPVAHATYAAPVAHAAYAAPVAHATYAAPVAHAAYAAPVAHAAYAAPVIAKTYAAAPVIAKAAIAYSPATVVSHASFSGLGAHYEW